MQFLTVATGQILNVKYNTPSSKINISIYFPHVSSLCTLAHRPNKTIHAMTQRKGKKRAEGYFKAHKSKNL